MSRLVVCRLLTLFVVLASTTLLHARQVPDTTNADDEQLFRSALPIDGKTVLAFFHKLTLSGADQKRIQVLITQLDSELFKERDKATNQLIAEGPRALPLLRKAMLGAPLERYKRVERCIKAVERADWMDVIAASCRLLARHRPEGAAAALLAYVPFAPADATDDVTVALAALSTQDGKVDPMVIAALDSTEPMQRAAAAIIVGQRGTPEQRQVVFALLDDKDDMVRFRAAQGLLASKHQTAVPILIGLLHKAPRELAETAESILHEVAGESAPKIDWTDAKENREKCQAAWLAWWHQHQDKLALDKLETADVAGLTSPERLAKKAGLKLWKAMAEGDMKTIRQTTALPFAFERDELTTPEKLEKIMRDAQPQVEKLFASSRLSRVAKAEAFAKTAAETWSKEYLEKLKDGRFYAVCVLVAFGSARAELAFVVRVRGGAARVVGLVINESGK